MALFWTLLLMKKRSRGYVDPAQAKRTAWRQILRWIDAQLALIEVGQASAFEVFMPYLTTTAEDGSETTMATLLFQQRTNRMLPPGESKP